MAYTKPQVRVFQEFQLTPTEITEPLRAHISGGNADLHRYSEADEKATINLGAYDRVTETCYEWPGKEAGSVVDLSYAKLFIDDALLLYLQDDIGANSVIAPVAGYRNRVRSDTLAFKDNGTGFPRSAILLDRDVKLGDSVHVRGVDGDAAEHELWTTVKGFAAEVVPAVVDPAEADSDNAASQAQSTTIAQIDGAQNCVGATADGSLYDGLADGDVSETYTIEVTQSSVGGDFTTAELRVTSASGRDDDSEVVPAASGSPTAIGARGLDVTFDLAGGTSCSSSASAADVDPTNLIAGQKWRVTVAQAFEQVQAQSGGTYEGTVDDTYIIEVTKGGTWDDAPQITVTTAKGSDFSGPTTITDDNVAAAIGNFSVTALFYGTGGASSLSSGSVVALDPVAGLRKGDKFYITVTAESEGRASTLILANNLPQELVDDATDLDLKLFIKSNIQVSENRTGFAPVTNWEASLTEFCVADGIIAYDESWTDDGVPQALDVYAGTLFLEYREWLAELVDEVNGIDDTADIDEIPGPLHPDNPLKQGVYSALLNSNGTIVRYTGVADPEDPDAWTTVLSRIKGRDDIYNLVPLTHNQVVLNLFQGHVDAESSATAGNWKAMFVNLQGRSERAVVDETTSSDEDVVLAKLEDDPNTSGTQYTLLTVPAGNANFETNGVAPGDIVRYLYTTDGFDNEEYTEFVVDSVISEDSLLLFNGHTAAINVPQKIEVWHTLSKTEISDEVAAAAAVYSNRRVCAVWPDTVASAGQSMDGVFLCAAIAGLVSGVSPHQGLTNVELAGFDDVSRASDFFNSTQLDAMAESGVWIVTKDRDGTVITRHALTTDNTDLNSREEMIRRNLDAISYLFLHRLAQYIGKTNVTPTMLLLLENQVRNIINFLKNSGFTQELGAQLIDADIISIQQAVLAKDRVEIVLSLTLPAPLNNIDLHLIV